MRPASESKTMFTGIIQKLGSVTELVRSPSDPKTELKLRLESDFNDVTLGESIAINGVCLTVTEFTSEGSLFFYVSRETLERTNFDGLKERDSVNLERALRASDRLSGHIVQGHVDGLASFLGSRAIGDSYEVRFELPESLSRYCVEKGSIALNGVSLTLNQVQGNEISIMLIPHTWEHTNLSKIQPGAKVNVEIDIFAKYFEKYFLSTQKQKK